MTSLKIKLDEELKRKFERLCKFNKTSIEDEILGMINLQINNGKEILECLECESKTMPGN
jgi:hypothetical protein